MTLQKLEIANGANKGILIEFLMRMPSKEADSLLVEIAAAAMKERLDYARERHGKSGWQTAQCENDLLKKRLIKNVEEEDWVDVMNLAAMLYVREQIFEEVHYAEAVG